VYAPRLTAPRSPPVPVVGQTSLPLSGGVANFGGSTAQLGLIVVPGSINTAIIFSADVRLPGRSAAAADRNRACEQSQLHRWGICGRAGVSAVRSGLLSTAGNRTVCAACPPGAGRPHRPDRVHYMLAGSSSAQDARSVDCAVCSPGSFTNSSSATASA